MNTGVDCQSTDYNCNYTWVGICTSCWRIPTGVNVKRRFKKKTKLFRDQSIKSNKTLQIMHCMLSQCAVKSPATWCNCLIILPTRVISYYGTSVQLRYENHRGCIMHAIASHVDNLLVYSSHYSNNIYLIRGFSQYDVTRQCPTKLQWNGIPLA